MKTRPSRRNRGFTLIELLVVIAIIAVLAAASFGMVNMAMKKARRVTALQTASSLELAVNQYFSEYGKLPTLPGGGNSDRVIDTTTAEGTALLTILLGKETGQTMENPKGLKFLDAREGKGNKGGLIYAAGGSSATLYDPWGGPFYLAIDYDYDDEITPNATDTGTGTVQRGKKVLVYSKGVDKAGGKEAVRNW